MIVLYILIWFHEIWSLIFLSMLLNQQEIDEKLIITDFLCCLIGNQCQKIPHKSSYSRTSGFIFILKVFSLKRKTTLYPLHFLQFHLQFQVLVLFLGPDSKGYIWLGKEMKFEWLGKEENIPHIAFALTKRLPFNYFLPASDVTRKHRSNVSHQVILSISTSSSHNTFDFSHYRPATSISAIVVSIFASSFQLLFWFLVNVVESSTFAVLNFRIHGYVYWFCWFHRARLFDSLLFTLHLLQSS